MGIIRYMINSLRAALNRERLSQRLEGRGPKVDLVRRIEWSFNDRIIDDTADQVQGLPDRIRNIRIGDDSDTKSDSITVGNIGI